MEHFIPSAEKLIPVDHGNEYFGQSAGKHFNMLAHGAVAGGDSHGTTVARQVLLDGGNAVDAAVAAALALAVTCPQADHSGGGGCMNIHIDGESYFLDYRQTAPAATHGNRHPAGKEDGAQDAAVPGTVMGLWVAHRRFGKRSWKDILRPAMALAHTGFHAPGQMRKGGPQAVGASGNANPPMDFSDGFFSIRGDALLAAYRAKWTKPLSFPWRGMQVLTAPPPSAGGMALAQLLEIKSQQHKTLFKGVRVNTASYIHLSSEMMKLALSESYAYLAEPEFSSRSADDFLPAENLSMRATQVNALEIATAQAPQSRNSRNHITHFSVIDQWGNAVSNTCALRDAGTGALSLSAPTILLKDGRVEMVLGTPGGAHIPTHLYQVLTNVFDYGLDLQCAVAARRFHHQLPQASFIVEEPYSPLPDRCVAELAKRGYSVQTAFFDTDVQAIHVVARQPIPVADPRGRGWGVIAR
ncbi:MAG: gamma-glutamyltransferase [Comamonas sp.]